jgi:hypothetical protein
VESDKLASTKLKLDAADSHIKDLVVLINAFYTTDPKPVRSYVDIEGDKQVFKVEHLRDLPGTIYTRIGDALSNTRSSLDHLAGALAVRNGQPANHSNFPIAGSKEKFESKKLQGEQKFGAEAWAMIGELNPYRGGNDLLWSLNTLRNMDTHETVVPIASTIPGFQFNLKFHIPEPGDLDLVNSPRYDEFKVARLWRLPANATVMGGRTKFGCDIGFTKVEPVEGQRVATVLEQFLDLARSTATRFEQSFFN